MSFEGELNNSFVIPTRDTIRDLPHLVPLIAPLWADFNFRDSGTIYYEVSSEPSLLETVAKEVQVNDSAYAGFTPTEAVIVTWFQGELLKTGLVVSYC